MGLSKSDAVDLQGNHPNEFAAPSGRQNYPASWTPFFVAVLLFVAGVSLYDGYLVVRTGTMIRQFELNPVGLYLINCDDGDINVFLRVKAAGTLVTLAGLCVLHRHSRRLAGPVELALVVFQGGLLLFLENPFS
jgi:hypothetical protein